MASERPLDQARISEIVLRLDFDMLLTATWAHLCQDEIDSGRLAFPVNDLDQLSDLITAVENTMIRWRGREIRLAGPEDDTIPPAAFPITDLADFARKVLMVVHVHHRLDPDPDNPSMGKYHE